MTESRWSIQPLSLLRKNTVSFRSYSVSLCVTYVLYIIYSNTVHTYTEWHTIHENGCICMREWKSGTLFTTHTHVYLRYFNFILIFCSRLPIFEAGKQNFEVRNGVKVLKWKIRVCVRVREITWFSDVCGNLVFI